MLVKIKQKYQSGFGIVEVVVSVAIFTILVLGMLAAFGAVTRAVKISREKIILSSLSSNYLEIVRNMPYASVGTISGNPNGTLPDQTNAVSQTIGGTIYKIYYEVTYVDDPADYLISTPMPNTDVYAADYKQVKMFIVNNTTSQVTAFVTNVVPKGLEGTNNQGALRVQVIDAQGNPVANAAVKIEYPTTTPSLILNRQTDSSGYLTEVGLPLAVNNYRITATKAGFSTDRTYPITGINPSPIHPDATIANGQITSITFSIDALSSLNIRTLDAVCQPISGINLNVKGIKLIGTPSGTSTNPNLYKFNNNYSSTGGVVALSNVEWDTYTPVLLTGQTKIVYGTSPIQRIDVLPGTIQTFNMILGDNSTSHSLLVVVKDAATHTAVEGATVSIDQGGATLNSFITGGSVWTTNNWTGGSGMSDYSSSSPSRYYNDNGFVDVTTSGMVKLEKVSGNYVASTGTLESATFDTGTNLTKYTILSWQPNGQSASTSLAFQVAANNDNTTWNYVGPDGTADTYFTTPGTDMGAGLDNNRYFRYKAFLKTLDTSRTPILTSVSVNFVTGCYTPGQVIFTGLNNASYNISVTASGYSSYYESGINVNGNQALEIELTP